MASTNTPLPSDFPENGPDNRGAHRRTRHPEAWIDDLEATLRDASATDLEALKARLSEQLHATRRSLRDASDHAGDLMRETIDCTEEYIHARPWQAIGLVAGAAFLFGVVVGRQ
ncbi:DUF883 domain-containing protein [Achromobacter pestifer]|uniref:DUF883 domain-containing protein n=1 Tax=Achromobacter pestifer TaxID=1353889 RepID=A0A7D4E1A2_9BURK|nr:DUF883 family protein [Achromobacter pestifer]QKH38785.1 DUF883 domain-containing protein [Achromobacter pestifer]